MMQLDPRASAAGVRLVSHEVLTSTNAEALSLARQDERGPLWVTATQQTAGDHRQLDRAEQEQRARSLLARGGVEDNEMSAGVQRGLRAGANSFVEFGRHESAIGHFHATLDARLALFV